MVDWKSKPTITEIWDVGIDYVMFVDENGNDSKLSFVLSKINNNEIINENDRYFTITGCIFEKKFYKKAVSLINELKNKYWENGNYFDLKSNKLKKVCMHSRDIRRHDGAFNDKLINYNSFINELSNILEELTCKVISVTIDLYEYVKCGYKYSVYELAFDFLMERYIYTTSNHKKGIIMLEARGKNEDKKLLEHILNVMNSGNKKITSNELKNKIVGIYFNPKWNKEYSHTFTGLEIVDLFSYPIHQCIKYKQKNLSFKIVEKKIYKYPNYINKGLKIFPKNKR